MNTNEQLLISRGRVTFTCCDTWRLPGDAPVRRLDCHARRRSRPSIERIHAFNWTTLPQATRLHRHTGRQHITHHNDTSNTVTNSLRVRGLIHRIRNNAGHTAQSGTITHSNFPSSTGDHHPTQPISNGFEGRGLDVGARDMREDVGRVHPIEDHKVGIHLAQRVVRRQLHPERSARVFGSPSVSTLWSRILEV